MSDLTYTEHFGKCAKEPSLAAVAYLPRFLGLSTLIALLVGAPACGNDDRGADNYPNPGAGGATSARGGGSATGGRHDSSSGQPMAGTGAIDPGLPLIERPSLNGYDCTVGAPAKLLQINSNDFVLNGLTTSGDTSFLARAQVSETYGLAKGVVLSTLSANCETGTPITLKQNNSTYYTRVTLVTTRVGMFVLALESATASTNIVYAKLATDGTVEVPMTTLASIGGNGNSADLVAAPASDAIGILWSTTNGSNNELDFGILRFDGTFSKSTGVVASSPNWTIPAGLVATDQGYLASYAESGSTSSGTYVRAIAADGTLGAMTAIHTSSAYESSGRHAFLWRGNEALFAWSRTEGTYDNEQLGSTIALSRLDASGRRKGDDLRVSAWVRSQENVNPVLFARGDDVGLVWSQGSVIYICAGCMPDNHLEFAFFDGKSFAPKSAVLKMTNPATSGGLISPMVAQQGDDIIAASVVGYHTSSELAAGSFHCQAR